MKQLGIPSAIALLALFGWTAASVSDEHSTTADEIFHVTAGYAYWTHGDYRLQPENGNLPQRWGAIPLLWQRPAFPATDQPAWRAADPAEIGFQFFYEKGNDLARMLRSARAMMALLGVALGALVFMWSRSLFGLAGALVSVGAFAFCPNLLAHAGLVTSDMAACLGFIAATAAAWRLLHRVSAGRVVAAGAAFALLALAKFSAVLLVPLLVLLLLTRALRRTPLPVRILHWRTRFRGPRAWGLMLAAQAAAAGLAVLLVWAAFGFRFKAEPTDAAQATRFNQPWNLFFPEPAPANARVSLPMRVAKRALDLRVLPEAYLYGFIHTLHFAKGRPAFFMGEYRTSGWREFFPVAFLLKTPPALFALMGLAAAIFFWRRRRRQGALYRVAPLAVLLAVYWAFAVTSNLNIGHRHILVTYPIVAILLGSIALAFHRRAIAALTVCLLAAQAWTAFAIRPHYLAYFNPLLGGPVRAYQHFVDSSLDWGQDLPGLARWLRQHARGEKVYLSYFGSGHPPYHGIEATRIADGFFDLRHRAALPSLSGGVYCISATMFQQVYTMVRHGWTPKHEARYAELTRWLDQWRAGQDRTAQDAAVLQLVELEHLRFGRLCAGLRTRKPDDQIGYSILIFRLTDADVQQLLAVPLTSPP